MVRRECYRLLEATQCPSGGSLWLRRHNLATPCRMKRAVHGQRLLVLVDCFIQLPLVMKLSGPLVMVRCSQGANVVPEPSYLDRTKWSRAGPCFCLGWASLGISTPEVPSRTPK